MQEDTVLQRFQKFKAMIVSSNIPNNLLLEMIENYLASDKYDELAVEENPILDGQLSLLDLIA